MIALWSAMRSRARPAAKHGHGDAHGVGAVEALELAHQPLVVEVEVAGLGGELGGQPQVLGRPGPQRDPVASRPPRRPR